MKSPWEFFKLEELKCKCGKCGSTGLEMQDEFMRSIVSLRQVINTPFKITSAYRCPAYNSKISSTGNGGPHTTGKAIDFISNGELAYKLSEVIFDDTMKHLFRFTGIGVSLSKEPKFIHLDNLQLPDYPRPRLWSY